MKDKTTKDLAFRLSEIEREKFKLDMEYNKIVQELWDRIPSLKDDVNLQKKKVRKYENNRFVSEKK
jgi:hypothetical protein